MQNKFTAIDSEHKEHEILLMLNKTSGGNKI